MNKETKTYVAKWVLLVSLIFAIAFLGFVIIKILIESSTYPLSDESSNLAIISALCGIVFFILAVIAHNKLYPEDKKDIKKPEQVKQ